MRFQQGENLLTQIISRETQVLIAGVVDPLQIFLPGPDRQLRAGKIQQGPRQPALVKRRHGRHGRQAVHPGPAQQLQ